MMFSNVFIPTPKNRFIRQFLAVLSGLICHLTTGMSVGWSSPALMKLQNNETSPIPITSSEGSTVASIFVVGGVISPILYALMVDVYGRKWMMFIGILFHISNWILLYCSNALYQLYIARILLGFGMGFSYGLVPTYIGEVTENSTRSIFGVMTSVLIVLGELYAYSVGPYVDFYMLSLCNLIFPVLALVCLIWMPESPYFLVRQKRYDEARRNVMWLRAKESETDIEKEMEDIDKFVASSPKRPFLEVMKEMSIKINRQAIFILTLLMIGQQFNGNIITKTYFHSIVEETGITFDVNISVILLQSPGLVILFFSFFMVNRVGRKALFMLTCFGCAVGTLVTGLYFSLLKSEILGNEGFYMAIVGILCIQISNSFGGSTVPTLITSEMSTASIRSWLGAYKTIAFSTFNSVSVKLFQIIRDGLGVDYAFWLFTIILVAIMTILVFVMPETRGKSLQEIQDMLSKDKKKNSIITS